MSVSPLANPDQIPEQDQLWMFQEIFRNDWTSGVSVSSEYRTTVESALSQAEQRYGLMSRPLKTMTVSFQAGGRRNDPDLQSGRHFAARETSSLLGIARRYTMAKSLWPLFSDETVLTSAASSSDTVISCDTNNIRFSAGSRVLIVSGQTAERADGPYYSKNHPLEVAEVSSVGAGQIAISSGLVNDYPNGSRIFPLFEARLIFSIQGSIVTDSLVDLTVTAIEEEGATQLPGTVPIGSTSGMIVHELLPVFDPNVDYAEDLRWGVVRSGQRATTGISGYSEAYGSRGLMTFNLFMNHLSREEAFETIKFFDSRGGRQRALWLLSPLSEYYDFVETLNVIGEGVITVILRSAGSLIDWTFRPYIFFKKVDGTVYIREVESVLAGTEDLFTLTLATPLPESLSPSDVSRVGVAYKSRLDQDILNEDWETTEIMRCPISIIELEEEKSVTIADLTEIVSSDLLVKAVQGDCSGTSFLLYPCSGCGSQLAVCDSPGGGAIKVARTEWAPSTGYSKGDHVYRPGESPSTFEVYMALNDGTSGAVEPAWIDECDATFFDNDIEWERSDFIYGVIQIPVSCTFDLPSIEEIYDSCGDAADDTPGYVDSGPPSSVDDLS